MSAKQLPLNKALLLTFSFIKFRVLEVINMELCDDLGLKKHMLTAGQD